MSENTRITPKIFLKLNEVDIIENLKGLYSQNEAYKIYNELNEYVDKLSSIRSSETQTRNALDKLIKFPSNNNRTILYWLLKALDCDDTYMHSFNYIAQYHNRIEYILFETPIKRIQNNELIELLLTEEKNQQNSKNELTGFSCIFHPDTVAEIFELMKNNKPEPQIKGRLKDFQAIFAQNPTLIYHEISWNISHAGKANNRAFHAFLRLMLNINDEEELPREILKKANKCFIFKGNPIYPNNSIKYPSKDKTQTNWIKSSRIKHFSNVVNFLKKQDQTNI